MRPEAVRSLITLAALIDMAPEQRPFRTVVSAPIRQLLDAYNVTADALRPIVHRSSMSLSSPELLYRFLRRSPIRPTSPRPSNDRVLGSGTELGGAVEVP
jgi:hypothetical protein